MLSALRAVGFIANPDKCEWGGCQLLYLRHVVGNSRLAVPEDRAIAMGDYVRPSTKKGLRSFLGSINYYRRFVPNMAELTSKRTPSTSKMAPGKIQWEPGMVEAFHMLRECYVNVCMLTVPSPDDEFTLHTDALLLGVGGVLNVLRADEELRWVITLDS